jgi:prevent-host-death family protein
MIELKDVKPQIDDLLKRAAAGEEFVVVEQGQPVARLKPAKKKRKRIPNLHAGLMETTADFDAPLNEDFEEAKP